MERSIIPKNYGDEDFAGESGHIDMDRLMVECLESLGYKDGCNILFSMTHIWYA